MPKSNTVKTATSTDASETPKKTIKKNKNADAKPAGTPPKPIKKGAQPKSANDTNGLAVSMKKTKENGEPEKKEANPPKVLINRILKASHKDVNCGTVATRLIQYLVVCHMRAIFTQGKVASENRDAKTIKPEDLKAAARITASSNGLPLPKVLTKMAVELETARKNSKGYKNLQLKKEKERKEREEQRQAEKQQKADLANNSDTSDSSLEQVRKKKRPVKTVSLPEQEDAEIEDAEADETEDGETEEGEAEEGETEDAEDAEAEDAEAEDAEADDGETEDAEEVEEEGETANESTTNDGGDENEEEKSKNEDNATQPSTEKPKEPRDEIDTDELMEDATSYQPY